MKRTAAYSLLFLMPAALALGQTVEREIIDLENKIGQAIVNKDAAFVDRVWGDDFFYTGIRGEIKNKQDILRELKSGDLTFDLLQFDDIKVRHFGDTAIATGLATTKGRTPQGEVTGRVRYTRVYVKRQSAWQLIVFQGTSVQ